MSSEISTNKQDVGEISQSDAENKEKKINLYQVATIIVGSTNFFFNFKDKKETIPVLLLFHKDEKFFREEVINKLQEKKYLKDSMIFFDFLYYLDKKYKTSKETLIKRNLYNKDLSFIDKKLDNLDVKEKIEFEKTISFEYAYLSTNNNSHVDKDGKKIIPSQNEKGKSKTVQTDKNLNAQYFTSEQLLNMYIENLLEKKLKNLNEKFNLNLILPLYLDEEQKDKIKKIFENKLNNNENFKEIFIEDEMNFYLEKIKTKIENKKVEKTSENEKTQNKIIFIHFGGSSLVIILYDCDAGKIIKRKEKLIGGIDIDIKLTKDSLSKFTNENKEYKISDSSLIYKVKNKIEEEKKNLYSNNKDKLEINIEKFKHNKPLKYELNDEDEILSPIDDILEGFENIIINILENVNEDEIKNVICIGNNFKFIIFKKILFEHLPEELCEFIFE
jgi:hypothetical protein